MKGFFLIIKKISIKLIPGMFPKTFSCTYIYQILGIAKGVALRLRRLCSRDDAFFDKSRIYIKYLIDCGHDSAQINRAFEVVSAITRVEARASIEVKLFVIPVFFLLDLILLLPIFEKFFANIALFWRAMNRSEKSYLRALSFFI